MSSLHVFTHVCVPEYTLIKKIVKEDDIFWELNELQIK